MSGVDLGRRLAAEAMGTAFLLATVVGSGIMAERLAGGNLAIALLGNTLATGAMLVVLITVLGPISGAHFNPAVTLVFALRREIAARDALCYAAVQFAGAVVGVAAAHAMFGMAAIDWSQHVRSGPAQALSEAVATFGLIATILGTLRFKPDFTSVTVGLYVTAGYWFTASTCFANPAVTVARSLTDSFSGIRPVDAPVFILAQCVGTLAAAAVFAWLLAPSVRTSAQRNAEPAVPAE
jgi:glycerol uptake facilitator-like aquaporin